MPAAPSNYSMKTLNNVQTHLQTYLGEMMQIAAKNDKRKYFIADARGTKEFSGKKNSRAADMNCGPNFDEQCHVPLQGHIRGAIDFPYTDLLIMNDQKEDINGDGKVDKKDASFKFKSPADLEKYYYTKGYRPNQKIVTYCRTGRKATLVTLTASAVLNYPVSMYDGSWIQWGEMANRRDVTGSEILPAGSHLNLDDPKYSVVTKRIEPEYTQAGAAYEINLNATKSDKIINEDKAYMK
jgi:3-mercaptopyruvate sulfurtransferase SseA